MLLKHSSIYLLARGIPGGVNLFALALFSRLLSPDQYGRYALVLAGAGLASSFIYTWLQLGLLRFLTFYKDREEAFLSTIAISFMSLTALTGGIGGIAWVAFGKPEWKSFFLLGLTLFWVQAAFDLTQELMRTRLTPGRYGLAAILKALFSLGLAWLAVKGGWGGAGLIIGLIGGNLVPLLWQAYGSWRVVRLSSFDRTIFKQLLGYGLPLTLTFAFGFVVDSSDRFLLGWLINAEAAGLYSVGANLAQQSLVMLMTVVNLAAYPLAVKALEEFGEEGARVQTARNGRLLLMVSCPAAVGMGLLAPNIAALFLGESFRSAAGELIPWIAAGAFLGGFKGYHLDLSFQLGRRTVHQIWIVCAAAVLNILLNWWWIPIFGIKGSAYATVAACLTAAILSWSAGRKVFRMGYDWGGIGKIMLATAGMAAALFPFRHAGNLAVQIIWGAGVYFALLCMLHLTEMKSYLPRREFRGYRF